MEYDKPFKKNHQHGRTNEEVGEIDIQHNTQSIIYKYNHDNRKDDRIESKNIGPSKPTLPLGQELSKITLSPNHEEAKMNFAQYRSKANILYEFENYLVYNKLLGEGSFSKVYLGEAKKTKKLVAIKEVQKLEENEIACLMNSESPFIIKLYSFWTHNKHSYIALELCDGNLREILEITSVQEKIIFFEQIVEGINYLNKKNIIHRDLKFENILLKNNIIKISDFGFAKPIGSKLAVFSQKCGTPYTMAPQIYFHNGQGKPVYTHKCDIYSLGVILHEMLYQRHPFDYSAQKMRNNDRIFVSKKFAILDALIDRSLQQQTTRRCNWNEFMQIYSLFKKKKNQETFEALRQRNFNIPQVKQTEPKLTKKLSKNDLLKYKRVIFQTPVKNEANKQFHYEKQNPFNKIRLPQNENPLKKAEQRKPIKDEGKKQASQHNLVDKKLRQQAWKMEHDQYFQDPKESPAQIEAISAVKLVFLIIMVFSFIALLQKQFQ